MTGGNAAVAAQEFPRLRPLTLAVPHGRGGSTDTAARIVTRHAERYLGRPINIVNLAGINGFFAIDLMVDSIKGKPDGYSMCTANSSIILSPLVSETKYDYMREIKPLAMYAEEPFLLASSSAAPWQGIQDLIEAAKKRPGTIALGHSGLGNCSHVVAEMFRMKAGIDVDLRGYDSGGQLAAAFARGEIQCVASNRSDLGRHAPAGTFRVLAVAAPERSRDTLLADAPTFVEAGCDIVAWLRQGIGVANGIPEPIFERLSDAFERMIHEPGTAEAMEAAGLKFKYLPGADYAKLWESERSRWIKALGGTLQESIRRETRTP